jgi:hypothetical protein
MSKQLRRPSYMDDKTWYQERPESVQALIRQLPPGSYTQAGRPPDFYYMPYSYEEDGTVTMTKFSAVDDRPIYRVFGMQPDTFVPRVALPTERREVARRRADEQSFDMAQIGKHRESCNEPIDPATLTCACGAALREP